MREILFRGKRINNGEWVKGFYVCDPQEDYEHQIYTVHTHPCGCHLIPYSINCETIGQYTGLNDKNDNKIFEGDIISIPFMEERSPYEPLVEYYENAVVYFDNPYGWYVRFQDGEAMSILEYDNLDIEIIGNIYDNPELLGGE